MSVVVVLPVSAREINKKINIHETPFHRVRVVNFSRKVFWTASFSHIPIPLSQLIRGHWPVIMQRVARQAVYAERRAVLKREKIEKSKKRRFDKEQKVSRQRWRTAVGRLKRDAMAALRTDVELGDLAPRRDIGMEADKFGTMPDAFRMGPVAHPNVFRRLYDKRHQNTTELFRSYKVDDKVIIVDGIGQGKVGYIKDVVWDTQKVRLAGVLEVCHPGL